MDRARTGGAQEREADDVEGDARHDGHQPADHAEDHEQRRAAEQQRALPQRTRPLVGFE